MKTTPATVIDLQSMKTATATVIERQFLSPDYCNLIRNSLEVLNNMEIDLESIMLREFARGLPSDIDGGDL
ncbi:hypothetical protein [Nostoc commune]|uniref:hypothetical protein n=1 Tax=Nostoc commune TaxID=1178 RepID=UPI0018C5D7E1|nr:hypothetical protein [Nostoc commune]MBG1264605.1 hypothetical protein [Nostoc commune BAE]